MTNKESNPSKQDISKNTKQLEGLSMLDAILKGDVPILMTEEQENQGYSVDTCPYGICNGSGLIIVDVDGEDMAKNCQCCEDKILLHKKENSNIREDYYYAEIQNLREIDVTLLTPKKQVAPRKTDKRIKDKNNIPPEKTDAYIARVYDEKKVEKGIKFFATQYTNKTLLYLDEEPRTRSRNLMLIGQSGRQKTYLACAIATEFLKKEKSVYFTTMQDLINHVYDEKVDLDKIMTEIDLLIIDELGKEYHTDSEWAMKMMMDLFRKRKNRNLPIICTSNYYPNAWEELYDPSFNSVLNGSFFITLLESELDFRIEQIEDSLNDYDFFD